MCGPHYSIRGHYPYAHYGNIHLQLNTFISPFQHKFVEKPRFERGWALLPISESPGIRSVRLPIPPLLRVCPPIFTDWQAGVKRLTKLSQQLTLADYSPTSDDSILRIVR